MAKPFLKLIAAAAIMVATGFLPQAAQSTTCCTNCQNRLNSCYAACDNTYSSCARGCPGCPF